MSTFFSVLFGIFIFSLLIFVHELGHFLSAKASGVQVNEFSMFMGPALFKKQVGETLYTIRCIPLGGYCAMEGEDEDTDNPRSFQKAAWWKRFIILVSGAAMNFLIGLLIFLIVMLATRYAYSPVVSKLHDCATMQGQQGLMVGDRIVSIDGEKIYVGKDVNLLLSINPSHTHDFVVERNGEKVVLNGLENHEHTRENGTTYRDYGFSISIKELTMKDKIVETWNTTLDNVRNVRLSLVMLFTGRVGIKDLSGPVGIISNMSDVAAQSPTWVDALLNMLYFGGFIAVSLGVMNLLPIPALDGGRVVGLLLTTGIEAVTKKKINPKYEGYIHGVGMILLLALMAVVLFKDVFTIIKG